MKEPKDYFDKYLVPIFTTLMISGIAVSIVLLTIAMLAGIKFLVIYLF